jgi:hypothetical protein
MAIELETDKVKIRSGRPDHLGKINSNKRMKRLYEKQLIRQANFLIPIRKPAVPAEATTISAGW